MRTLSLTNYAWLIFYESDLALLMGVNWNKVISHALKEINMYPDQYGGLPGQDCT